MPDKVESCPCLNLSISRRFPSTYIADPDNLRPAFHPRKDTWLPVSTIAHPSLGEGHWRSAMSRLSLFLMLELFLFLLTHTSQRVEWSGDRGGVER